MRKLTRSAKKSYERDVVSQIKVNSKAFWHYAQSKMKSRVRIPNLDTPSGGIAEGYAEKSEVLADFFSSVFTLEPNGDLTQEPQRSDKTINSCFITTELVSKKLGGLKPSKSPGPDGIHPRVLRELKDILSKPLAIIFNYSLETGTLPKDWKRAVISAIYKKGSKSSPGNYRPVSLTSVVGKVMESIIRDKINSHMIENKLYSPRQYGFISGRSTTLQLLKVLDMWTQILEKGGSVDVVYCDFIKAFDKVPHRRLLNKIESYGIKGRILDWVKSFLKDREQRV